MIKRYFSETELQERFDEIFEMCENGDHIFVTRDGIPVAVLIPYDNYIEMKEALGEKVK